MFAHANRILAHADACIRRAVTRSRAPLVAFPAVLGLSFSLAAAEIGKTIFNIEAQPAPQSLTEYALQANVQVGYTAAVVEDVLTNPVKGEYDNVRALELLLKDTGLTAEYGERGIFIRRIVASEVSGDIEAPAPAVAETTSLQLMQSTIPALSQGSTTSVAEDNRAQDDQERVRIEEITVTGTHIRGQLPVGAHVLTIDRQTIEQTGLSTIADVIQRLPQALGTGPNLDTSSIPVNVADDANHNPGLGSSINIRGVGPDSTLTLINGRRVASSGRLGGFVDISMVPLTAVERIEILADGASALYGSDAIGGVVNVILRDDYEGAETRVRYGTVTSGSRDDIQFSQALGSSWGSGNMILAYEYRDRHALLNSERAYAANSDLTSLGGDDFDLQDFANPGTILSLVNFQTYAIPEGQDGTSLTPADFVGLAGTHNDLNRWGAGTTLLPDTKRHSLFAAISQRLSKSVELFSEVRYTRREFDFRALSAGNILTVPSTNPFFVDPTGTGASSILVFYSFVEEFGADKTSGKKDALNLTLGSKFALFDDWQLELYGTYDEQQVNTLRTNAPHLPTVAAALADPDPATAFNPFADGANSNPATIAMIGTAFNTEAIESDLWEVNATADGTLLVVPGGEVKVAVGLDYREETLNREQLILTTTPEPRSLVSPPFGREIFAAFAEVSIPIFGEGNRRPGLHGLDLSIAGRFEEYSDFGTTTNPRVGLSWAPSNALTLRATYSESFRAPLLTELRDDNLNALALTGEDPGVPSGISDKLLISGGNPFLKPETAKTWSAGFDLTPDSMPGFRLGVTYFSIDIDDRIAEPDSSSAGILADPEQYAEIITRNPDPSVVQSWFDQADTQADFRNPPGALIDVIVDTRLNNVSVSEIRGIDLIASYDFETNFGTFGLYSNSSYFSDYREAFTSTAPFVETLDTLNNQVDFRARNSVSWRHNGFAAYLYVNYVSGYTDDISTPNREIDPWTTADLNFSYTMSDNASSWLRGVKTSLIVRNLFDEDPPFVNNPVGVGFDPANASSLGRFVSVELVKDW